MAAAYDGTTMRVYVNGVEEKSAASAASVQVNATTPMTFGAASSGHALAATLDEVALYDSALSADRIATHYANRTD